MATVTYNSVSINKCKISRYSVENEFEGDNFNRTGRRHVMEGVGVISSTNAFTNKLDDIKNKLNKPGQTLSIQFDGWTAITMVEGYSTSTVPDARNGPLPAVNVTELIGSEDFQTFVVSFTFSWFECSSAAIQRCEVITTHSISEDGILRVHRRGFLRVSAAGKKANLITNAVAPAAGAAPFSNPLDAPSTVALTAANAPSNPDLYRRLVAGPPAPGYQRTKQEFYVQADQTTLAFDIEDVQLTNSLPEGVINGDASFEYERSLQSSSDTGMMGTKHLRVELVGAPATPKVDLFVRCIEIALSRIQFTGERQDFVESIKIAEPSLFKKNSVVFEVVAHGVTTSTTNSNPADTVATDEWLYKYLFSDPLSATNGNRLGTTVVDPYGSFPSGTGTPLHENVKYDPCTLTATWQAITGTSSATQVTDSVAKGDTQIADTAPKRNSQTVDPLMQEQAKYLLSFRASQSMDIVSNIDLLDTMGGDMQSGFQFAMPHAVVHQTVEMVTRNPAMAIPWPYLDDQYVVSSLNVTVNDAPPDASGNRIYAVHAERSLRVNVSMSNNVWISGGVGDDNNRTVRIVNYFPNSMQTGRNPLTGISSVDLRANIGGSAVSQGFASSASTGTQSAGLLPS